jgi:hypothetical protein
MRFLALIILFFAISPAAFAQPLEEIRIGLRRGSNLTLTTVSSGYDSAVVRITGKDGIFARDFNPRDFVVRRSNDTAVINSCKISNSVTTKDIALTIILDNSGSMFHAYDSLTKYLDRFIDSLADGFEANALTFDNVERKPTYAVSQRGSMYIALSGFTSDRNELKDFWHFYDTIRSDFTPLNDALLQGFEEIRYRRQKGDSARNDIVIVVTDGFDNASSTRLATLEEYSEALGITLFTISFRIEPDRKLDWLARKTHGRHFQSDDLPSLRITLDGLRRNISSSYVLRYEFPFHGAATGK